VNAKWPTAELGPASRDGSVGVGVGTMAEDSNVL
jgi:hypothetical protein